MNCDFQDLINICKKRSAKIWTDSRNVEKGDIFVAIPGIAQDGSEYISQALEKGASWIISENEKALRDLNSSMSIGILTKDARKAAGILAAAYWGSKNLPVKFIGITGTNGKTTSAFMLEHVLKSAGFKTGVIGTICYKCDAFSLPAPLTTPGPVELHEIIAKMADTGVDFIIMETSSHALSQNRAGEIDFSGALFTNLTQDHLDFHKDMEDYFRSKSRLFFEQPSLQKIAAINGDNPYGRRLLELLPDAISFGLHGTYGDNRHLAGSILNLNRGGIELEMKWEGLSWKLKSPLTGDFNASNLLGVQALALGLGIEPETFQSLEAFHGVCGRLERVANDRNLNIFVDYAHTPDALINVLTTLKKSGFKRIITVFGCGGNRDRTKRAIMGHAVAQYSDVAILTSDNPRYEDPLQIMRDVKPGLAQAKELHEEVDRRKATAMAIEMLEPEDALLIAGKGHEDYQLICGVKHHYSDQEVARELTACV